MRICTVVFKWEQERERGDILRLQCAQRRMITEKKRTLPEIRGPLKRVRAFICLKVLRGKPSLVYFYFHFSFFHVFKLCAKKGLRKNEIYLSHVISSVFRQMCKASSPPCLPNRRWFLLLLLLLTGSVCAQRGVL